MQTDTCLKQMVANSVLAELAENNYGILNSKLWLESRHLFSLVLSGVSDVRMKGWVTETEIFSVFNTMYILFQCDFNCSGFFGGNVGSNAVRHYIFTSENEERIRSSRMCPFVCSLNGIIVILKEYGHIILLFFLNFLLSYIVM